MMDIKRKLGFAIKRAESFDGEKVRSLSSRMVEALSQNANGFCFGKKLDTLVGRVRVDAFAERDERYIFVESKCTELYRQNEFAIVGRSYTELYEYINENTCGSISCEMYEHPSREGYMTVGFFLDGERVRYFDLARIIRLLLGIANSLMRGELSPKQIDLLYLLYDPTELDCDEDIKSVYEQICAEIISVDMNLLFVTILRYLCDLGVGELDGDETEQYFYKLTFTLCNQDFYTQLI